MKFSTKNLAYGAASAAISLVLHLVLLLFADKIQIGGVPAFGAAEPSPPRRVQIRPIELEPEKGDATSSGEIQASNRDLAEDLAARLREAAELKDLLKAEQLEPRLQPRAKLTGLGRNLVLPELEAAPSSEPPPAPRPEILEIDPADIPESHASDDRHVIPDIPRTQFGEKMLPSIAEEGAGKGAAPGIGLSMRLSPPSGGAELPALPELEEDDEDDGQSKYAADTDIPTVAETAEELNDEDDREPERPQSIDRLVNANLTLYRRHGNAAGFFRLDLTPNPRSEKLRAIPKDVLFLIDCSNSIDPPKLEVFKETVVSTLDYLNPGDRFNVVSFRIKPDEMFDSYVAVTPENIQEAKKHVNRLYRSGLTDVYAALAPYVGTEERHADRPLTVFIFTDGNSTVDDKLDNETLLRKIEAANREQVSVYSASCGKGTNRFLLDLLAYTNRGRPLHKKRLEFFDEIVVDFVRSHTDVIVSDVTYSATGDIDKEMYPRRLPLMYRGDTISVYGRWPAGTEEIAVQVVGKSANDEPLDYVYHISAFDAEPGNFIIEQDWVAQKAFYLISENTLNPDANLDDEIRALLDEHNLASPYSKD